MARLKSYLMAGSTVLCALGIGYVQQFGLALPASQSPSVAQTPLAVSSVAPVTSGVIMPQPPTDQPMALDAPGHRIEFTAASTDAGVNGSELPAEASQGGFDCTTEMVAEPVAGAMVDVAIRSSCHASERVTIHHQGMMFTEVMQPDGTLNIKVPALDENAIFMASFASGDGALATAEVSSLPFYDRVALQWTGDAGLQLHAREFKAEYFSEGHVWNGAEGNLTAAARGEGGFLVRLGEADTPMAHLVEIYTFPRETSQRAGDVALSVEAEVTSANCNQSIAAQTFELTSEADLRVRDLTLEIPGCDSTGDFLVLNNLVQDLTIAAR